MNPDPAADVLMPAQATRHCPAERHPRVRLQEAGTRLFSEKGFHATSIRDMTDACGLTPGALYNHFGAKDDVLYAIIMDGHQLLDARLDSVPADGSSRERLRGLVEAFVLHHTRYQRMAMVGDAWRVLDVDRREQVRRKRLQLRARLEDTVRAGVAAGEFELPALVHGDPVRLVVMAAMDMAFRVAGWYRSDGPVPPEDFARFYVDLVLHWVGAGGVRA